MCPGLKRVGIGKPATTAKISSLLLKPLTLPHRLSIYSAINAGAMYTSKMGDLSKSHSGSIDDGWLGQSVQRGGCISSPDVSGQLLKAILCKVI